MLLLLVAVSLVIVVIWANNEIKKDQQAKENINLTQSVEPGTVDSIGVILDNEVNKEVEYENSYGNYVNSFDNKSSATADKIGTSYDEANY